MAKSLLRQLLDITGLQLPNPGGQYHPSAYRDETVEKTQPSPAPSAAQETQQLTGVEKYLAKKNPEPVEQPAAAPAPELTGVEKYLAQKQRQEQEKAEAEAAKLANMTGVARYLANLETNKRAPADPAPTPAAPAPTKPLTGVDKYLAKQRTAVKTVSKAKAAKPAPAAAVTSAPKTKAPAAKPSAAASKPPSQATMEKAVQPAKPKKKEPVKKPQPAAKKVINLAENAVQCQAATKKGSQCRRTTNLETIQQTVDNKKYTFAVCTQHNNDEFTPFAELLG